MYITQTWYGYSVLLFLKNKQTKESILGKTAYLSHFGILYVVITTTTGPARNLQNRNFKLHDYVITTRLNFLININISLNWHLESSVEHISYINYESQWKPIKGQSTVKPFMYSLIT